MKARIFVTLGVFAGWLLFWITVAGSLPAVAAYAGELRSNTIADSVMRTLMSEHMRIPAVFSFMLLAILWAPVIESRLHG